MNYHGRLFLASRLHSRTSRKRPPTMSSLGGRLQDVVAYESLEHIESKFCIIRIW